jgi:hypothetical protein
MTTGTQEITSNRSGLVEEMCEANTPDKVRNEVIREEGIVEKTIKIR